jgi:hypothetical protein
LSRRAPNYLHQSSYRQLIKRKRWVAFEERFKSHIYNRIRSLLRHSSLLSSPLSAEKVAPLLSSTLTPFLNRRENNLLSTYLDGSFRRASLHRWGHLKKGYIRYLRHHFLKARGAHHSHYLLSSSTSRAIMGYRYYQEKAGWSRFLTTLISPFLNSNLSHLFSLTLSSLPSSLPNFGKILNSIRRVEEGSLIASKGVSSHLLSTHPSIASLPFNPKQLIDINVRRYGGGYRYPELLLNGETKVGRYHRSAASGRHRRWALSSRSDKNKKLVK